MTQGALFAVPDQGEALFRARVASYLAPMWVSRANALKVCGDAAVKLRCECGDACLVPYRCGSRSCPSCARIVAARKTARVANRVDLAFASKRFPEYIDGALVSRTIDELWDGKGKPRRKGWKLFTGTSRAGAVPQRYALDVLVERIQRVRGAWGPFWRSTPWGARVRLPRVDSDGVFKGYSRRARRDTAAVMGLEVAPGGMVHCHAAIYGEHVESAELAALWHDALGERAFVKIKAMRAKSADDFNSALREVLKYVTKWDKMPGSREQRAAMIEAAMRGVRRIEQIGFIRSMPGADALVEHDNPESCAGCGRSDGFSWSSIWEPDKVRANGGFGPVVALLDDAERRAFRAEPNPLARRREQLRMKNADLLDAGASYDATDGAADSAPETDTEAGQ